MSRKGRVCDSRSSISPSFVARSLDKAPSSPEKSVGEIFDRSPLDRRFPPINERGSTLVGSPRLQEISGGIPRFFNPPSIVSNIAQITTPPAVPAPTSATIISTSPEPLAKTVQPTEPASEDENHPPSAFGTSLINTVRSRGSHGSGLLSIITLPSFITNDRPRPYSSSAAVQLESPVQPQGHYRKQSSIFSLTFSGTNPSTPISPASDSDASGKRSRPTSSALQLITSVLKRDGSTSSLRSSSPSSRRSSRRSLGRRNPSHAGEDEAIIQWNKLPPLPNSQGTSPMHNRDSQRTSEGKHMSTDRTSSYFEKEPKPPFFLAAHIPLPPSPSTMVSSVSSLSYAPPSPGEIPPTNGFTTPYTSHSYPPLPPSIPSTPGSSSYPPLPPSAPSTPGKFNYPPLPPSTPSTPGQSCYPSLPPSIPSTPSTPGQFRYPPLPPSTPSTPGLLSYFPLPPSTPSTPGLFNYPPLPPSVPSTPSSADKFMDVDASRVADPLAINILRRPPNEFCRTYSDLDSPTTGTVSLFPENTDNSNDDGTGRSIYRQSASSCSAYSQFSGVQEVVLPPMPMWTFPSSPPPLMSPRGPRPRPLPPVPTQLSRSGTLYSQTSSTDQ